MSGDSETTYPKLTYNSTDVSCGILPQRRVFQRLVGLTVINLLLPLAALALDPSRSVFQYRCENWSRQNGLRVSSVNAIAQSQDGYIWLGTQQGLVRFDGVDFTPFPVPRTPMFVSQNISTLAPARKGGLWFGLRDGAAGYFNGGSFSPLVAPWEEPNMQVFGVREARDGSVWVAWNFGYARRPPDGVAAAESERSVGSVCYRTVYQDPTDRIWLGAADPGGVYYWTNGVRHAFPDESLRKGNIFAFALDKDGQFWIGTQDGLRCYDTQFRRKALRGLDLYAQVNILLVDRQGVLWIGTEGDGLIRYHDGRFTRFRTTDGLINDYVNALCEDAEGNLWIGTRGGITQLSDVKFGLYSAHEGLPGEPLGIAAGVGNDVLVATTKGLTHLDGKTATNFGTESGIANIYLKRVWRAKNGDIYFFDGNRGLAIMADGHVVKRHQRTEWPVAITEDSEGIIASFAGEICRVTRDAVVPFTYKAGLAPPIVWAVNLWPARDGSLWVASHRGVWRIKDGEFQHWSTDNGLSGSVANWVFEDTDGTIWAGLASGVARIKGNQLRCLSTADGLFDNFIYAIVPDEFGWFWVDSSAGIFRVRRKDLNDVADGKLTKLTCEAFNGQEAVRSNDKHAQEPTAARTADGRIWFLTAEGIVTIDPAHIPTNSVPPPVYIERMRINGREASGHDASAATVGRGELEFRYTAVSFVAPERIRFRYRLEGYDERWIEADHRRSAFYTNLKPGKYTFRVLACNADGVWNTKGDSVEIVLPPHFYETRWFLSVGLLVSGALLGGVYMWRVAALRHRQKKLQELNALLDEKVQSRTAELARANQQLADANDQLATSNRQLTDEIVERQRFEQEADKTNKQLLAASREAGMAEVATSVLHNVGNVLNSVNVSVSVMAAHLREVKFDSLARVGRLIADTPALAQDEKGQKIPAYLEHVSQHFTEQHTAMARELESLRKNIEHIKDIVQMQQNYSRLKATCEPVNVSELIDDAIRLSGAGLSHRHLKILREVDPMPLLTDKPKVLQVLVNLLRNAIHACGDANGKQPTITLRVARLGDERVRFEVEDNGMGISPENLGRLFTQGFTTRKDGHGYGLHSSALAAKAMGGRLWAASAGVGLGAVFTLDLPVDVSAHEVTPSGSSSPFPAVGSMAN